MTWWWWIAKTKEGGRRKGVKSPSYSPSPCKRRHSPSCHKTSRSSDVSSEKGEAVNNCSVDSKWPGCDRLGYFLLTTETEFDTAVGIDVLGLAKGRSVLPRWCSRSMNPKSPIPFPGPSFHPDHEGHEIIFIASSCPISGQTSLCSRSVRPWTAQGLSMLVAICSDKLPVSWRQEFIFWWKKRNLWYKICILL